MFHSRHRSRSAQGRSRSEAPPSPPSIVALFVVNFDQREGYKLVWSKSIPDIELEGVVDFKSLPSGLHNVKEDLVYFIHGSFAGISAFVNVPGEASQRNAQMLAVGALVPLSHGRMGKSWRHAEGLKKLAEEHISNSDRLRMLDEYWEKKRMREGCDEDTKDADGDSPNLKPRPKSSSKPNGYRRPRGISDATALMSSAQTLSPYHPAISLPKFINDFGPLVFPLYRAALLRKRIVMIGEPPVEQNCNFVYDLSILSSVPTSLISLLPIDSVPPLRLRPLFNVGIQDIPTLEITKEQQPVTTIPASSELPPSWIACTTDDVLATKPQLYDILVNLPPSTSSSPSKASPTAPIHINTQYRTPYPKIYQSTPSLSRALPKAGLKATQRDLRRYLNLRSGLRGLPCAKPIPPPPPPERRDRTAPRPESDDDQDTASFLSTSTSSSTFSRPDEVVEPTPWALIAYTSFIWWASAGEKKGGLVEDEEVAGEEEMDRALLGSSAIANTIPISIDQDGVAGDGAGLKASDEEATVDDQEEMETEMTTKETAIVGYFHRLTALMFTTVSDAISRVDGEGLRRGGDSSSSSPILITERDSQGGKKKGLGITEPETEQDEVSRKHNQREEDEEDAEAQGQGQGQEVDEVEEPHEEDDDEEEEEEEQDENAPLLPPAPNTTASDMQAEAEDETDLPNVILTSTDLTQMGLDIWSSADRSFVEEFVHVWWGRKAVVQGGRVECCGVRVL